MIEKAVAYLRLEQQMLAAEASGDDAAADVTRGEMDALWYALPPDAIAQLNGRDD